tara:strand:+ start:750 stop:1385 length:636 start_codon:yes stop_codon:yes gene_type:complete
MFKKYLILILFLFFFTATSKSNELDDLIDLYDQQVLSEDALYSSLKKMNQEFNSDQFDKLFNLFTNGVISKDDLLTSLISKTPNTESVIMEKLPSDTSVKGFNFISCKGNSDTCSIMNKFFIEYEMNNNVLELTKHNFLDEPDVVSVFPRKQFYNNDGSFSEIIDLKLNNGFLLKMSIKGLIKNNDFLINFYSLKYKGKEINSGNIELVLN